MAYIPGSVPVDEKDLQSFLAEEANRIKIAINEIESSIIQPTYDPVESHPGISIIFGSAPTSVIYNSGEFIQSSHSTSVIYLALGTVNSADMSISATLLNFPTTTSNNVWPLAVRMQVAGNGSYIGLRANGGLIQTFEVNNGVFNELGTAFVPNNVDTPFSIELKVVGTAVTVTEDDGATVHNSTTAVAGIGRAGYVVDFWNKIPTALSRNYILKSL